MNEKQQLAQATPAAPEIGSRMNSIIMQAFAGGDFDLIMQRCQMISETDLIPKAFKGKAGNVLIAIEAGTSIGLSPLASLQWIAMINDRPTLWGDALPAVVMANGGDLEETALYDNDGQCCGYTCRAKRHGRSDKVHTFTLDDAKQAGLLGKSGPWKTYPKRMLQMRARGFACRDQFPDWLNGMSVAEEVQDFIEVDQNTGEVVSSSYRTEPDTTRSESVLDKARANHDEATESDQAETVEAPISDTVKTRLADDEVTSSYTKLGDVYGLAESMVDIAAINLIVKRSAQDGTFDDEQIDYLRSKLTDAQQRLTNNDAS